MKKILILTTISGFLQQFEMNDVAILQEAGYEIHYASNFNNPIYEVNKEALLEKGIHLHHIDIEKSPTRIFQHLRAFLQLNRVIKEEKIKYIHCHNPMGGVLGRLVAKVQKSKMCVLYTAHGFHFYKGAPISNWMFYYPVEHLLAKHTDRLITINKEDYQRACKLPLRKNGKVYSIPGVGIDTSKFAPKEGERELVRAELNLSGDAFYIISVGELNANKNHTVILKAIASLPYKNIYYGICGRGVLKEELKNEAKALGIENRVKLFGFRKDIPKMLAAADCFAFPSKREGLGIASVEAMAAGIPLITSDCRGTREYMRDGINGLVCENGTVEEYAKAIQTLYENVGLRNKMSGACLQMAHKFDVSATDKIMRSVYSEMPEIE